MGSRLIIISVFPGFAVGCSTPWECLCVFRSGLLPHERESCCLQCWEFLHPGFHVLHCIGFSIGMTTWYLIYYHISFEEKPYSLLTPGQTIWTGLVGKATPSKTSPYSLTWCQ